MVGAERTALICPVPYCRVYSRLWHKALIYLHNVTLFTLQFAILSEQTLPTKFVGIRSTYSSYIARYARALNQYQSNFSAVNNPIINIIVLLLAACEFRSKRSSCLRAVACVRSVINTTVGYFCADFALLKNNVDQKCKQWVYYFILLT